MAGRITYAIALYILSVSANDEDSTTPTIPPKIMMDGWEFFYQRGSFYLIQKTGQPVNDSALPDHCIELFIASIYPNNHTMSAYYRYDSWLPNDPHGIKKSLVVMEFHDSANYSRKNNIYKQERSSEKRKNSMYNWTDVHSIISDYGYKNSYNISEKWHFLYIEENCTIIEVLNSTSRKAKGRAVTESSGTATKQCELWSRHSKNFTTCCTEEFEKLCGPNYYYAQQADGWCWRYDPTWGLRW